MSNKKTDELLIQNKSGIKTAISRASQWDPGELQGSIAQVHGVKKIGDPYT